MPLFTVVTPTFQRRETLPRVAASLARQSFPDMEWLVVDDGSTDGTEEVVSRLAARLPFRVRYRWQPNAGKHVALNRAAAMADGELLLCLDSDDELVPRALERLAHHWRAIPADQRERYSGVSCLCQSSTGRIVGTPFPQEVMDSDGIELRYRFRVRGDRAGVVRSDVLRRLPFEEPPGVTYLPESLGWDRIAQAYRTRCVNEALYVVHTGRPDRLTRRTARREQAPGLWRLHVHNLALARTWFREDPLSFLRAGANFTRFSLHLRLGPRAQWRALPGGLPRSLAVAGLPLGVALWADDLRRARTAVRAHGR